eukprot:jgi/Phyca11/128086/e_gw1.73.119.1
MTSRSSSSALQVFAVEGVARSILFYLDLPSFDAILYSFQATPELHGYLQDCSLWTELSMMHFKGPRDLELRFLTLPTIDRGWNWTDRESTCVELQEFLQSTDERAQFDQTVTILEGDIGYIHDIDGHPLDGIAFPTNSHLTNHYVGAAQAVFRRAGRGLTDHVNDPSFRGRRPTGSAVATPAFDAGVRKLIHSGVEKLIHCVGPSVNEANCCELLAATYENALNRLMDEDLHCIGMVSISTGNLGVPCAQGAKVAMRMLQKFLPTHNWDGNIAIVCNDENVLQAFAAEKAAILKSFNVMQSLPAVEPVGGWPGNHEVA